jgi:hypothetical protein
MIFYPVHFVCSQQNTGVIAGLFLEDNKPCSLRINLHNGETGLYFGKTESGNNGHYAFTHLPFDRYYLITHPVGVGERMPLQWRSKIIEINAQNPVYILSMVDGFSVKNLYPTDRITIDFKNISSENPLEFFWEPYDGPAEYEVGIFSTDSTQKFKSGRIKEPFYNFNGRFDDNSKLKNRLYRWVLTVHPKDCDWTGSSRAQDLCFHDNCTLKIYKGQFVKLEFPKWYEPTIRKLDLLTVLDICYQLEKELAADHIPTEGPKTGEKQAFFYDSKISFAHSGQPIHFGKSLINEGDFPFNIAFHEMAHNFQFGGLPGFMHLLGGEYYNKTSISFGFAEGLATLANLYITEKIKDSDINPNSLSLIREGREKMRRDHGTALRFYEQNSSDHQRITPDIIDGMMIHLGDQYGWDMFPKFFRIFLKNSTVNEIYALAGEDNSKRTTIIVAAFSAAAGTDLKNQFIKWDFPIDEKFYQTILPSVRRYILSKQGE